MTTSAPRKTSGFTLTELLMVMTVVAILYCISLSVIRAVSRSANKAAAQAELKSIEIAFKQYYSNYGDWPLTNSTDDASTEIDESMARILTGTETADYASNPEKMIFMEFARSNKDGVPMNPWGANGRYKAGQCLYHVAFDTDGDNYVRFPSNDCSKWAAADRLDSQQRARAGVIVWTFNPEISPDYKGQNSDAKGNDYLIGSW